MNDLYELFNLKEGCSIEELNSQFIKGLDFYNNNNKEMRDRLIKAYGILVANITKQNISQENNVEESKHNTTAPINVTYLVQYDRPISWAEIVALCRKILTQRLQQNPITIGNNNAEKGFSLEKIGLLITNTGNIIPVKYKFYSTYSEYNLYARNIYSDALEARWNQSNYLNGISDALNTFNELVSHKKLFLLSEFLPYNYLTLGFATESLIKQVIEVLQEVLMNCCCPNINVMTDGPKYQKSLLPIYTK